MKAEFTDVNETRKSLKVEISTDIVNEGIDRIARDYSKRARVPGFRPGKAPARIIKQRYKSEILHDLMNDLIPRAVDDARNQVVHQIVQDFALVPLLDDSRRRFAGTKSRYAGPLRIVTGDAVDA